MISSSLILTIIGVYFLALFGIAAYVEYRYARGKNLTHNGLIYALSLAIYATAWTFYGNIGSAVSNNYLFLAVYIGPTMVMLFSWSILRKMIKLKNEYNITSIAGLIVTRYSKSYIVGGVATTIILFGIMPYFALQLKAIFSSFAYITTGSMNSGSSLIQLMMLAVIILFTIIFGFRRLDESERRPGMVMVIAVQSIVKLVAFLAVGIFVTYHVFNGFGDIFSHINANSELVATLKTERPSFSLWISYMILSMSAILFLPRQFHLAVVENSSEKQIRTAMWFLPLYLMLITLFVFPIAMAGILKGNSINLAEIFSLVLPMSLGNLWLGGLVFIGGFSAAVSMIIVSTVAITTMCANYLVFPVIDKFSFLNFSRKYLLQIRWLIAIGILLVAYIFERTIGSSYILVKIGIISFVAVFQFIPAIIGGLYWERGNKFGAAAGLIAGFAVWLYTSMLPAFVRSGWLPMSILKEGPGGIYLLRPENLFGITAVDPLAITLLLTLFFNAGLYIFVSLLSSQSEEEKTLAFNFVNIIKGGVYVPHSNSSRLANIGIANKKAVIVSVFSKYIDIGEAKTLCEACIGSAQLENKELISIDDLIRLNSVVEKKLSSYIGVPAANDSLSKESLFTEEEANRLTDAYTRLAAEMKISPKDFSEKINYYNEKEKFLTDQREELENLVKARTKELEEKMQELEKWQKTTVSRELKMVELKKEIQKLEQS